MFEGRREVSESRKHLTATEGLREEGGAHAENRSRKQWALELTRRDVLQGGGRAGPPLREEGKAGRGQRWKRGLGKLKLDATNFSAKRNARPAAEKRRLRSGVYCLQ